MTTIMANPLHIIISGLIAVFLGEIMYARDRWVNNRRRMRKEDK